MRGTVQKGRNDPIWSIQGALRPRVALVTRFGKRSIERYPGIHPRVISAWLHRLLHTKDGPPV
jgi:hypothetical protein